MDDNPIPTNGGSKSPLFSGEKTYIVALIAAAAVFAKTMGWIDDSLYQTILALCGVGGLAALRAGVTKSGPQ